MTVTTAHNGELLVLLHDWRSWVEYDDGYVLGRCRVCGLEDLLDLSPIVMD